MTRRSANSGDGQSEVRPTDLEGTARTTLELCTGHSITDSEWAEARAKLLEFMTLLRDWELNAKTSASELGKVA